MKRINKIFIVSVMLLSGIFSFSLADNSDCGIFALGKYVNYSESTNSFEIVNIVRGNNEYQYSKFLDEDTKSQMMSKDDLNTAILNLKKYCCESEGKLGGLSFDADTCKADKNFFNSNSLDSQSLFDHLLDVIMRRLSGLTGDKYIYTETKMTVDEKGSERRERINEKAEDLSGSDAQSIIDKYQEFWKYHGDYDITSKMDAQFGDASNTDFLRYTAGLGGEESEWVRDALTGYKDWSMYDRYHNACALTEYFYALINAGIGSNDKINTINASAKQNCNNIVRQQIANENKYVGLITQRAGNRFLHNYVENYSSYLNNRRNTLREMQKTIYDRLLDISKKVPHLVNSCVK